MTKSKYARAPQELAEALGLPNNERVVRLLKSVYGLTAAPLEWYEQVNKVLTELGFNRWHTDPSVWTLVSNEELVGMRHHECVGVRLWGLITVPVQSKK